MLLDILANKDSLYVEGVTVRVLHCVSLWFMYEVFSSEAISFFQKAVTEYAKSKGILEGDTHTF